VPTYHLSAVSWVNAIPVFPEPAGDAFNINLVPVSSNAPGNGTIYGTVQSEQTRGMLNNVEMVLFNENSEPVFYMRTDSEGEFGFETLQLGTYKVHTEILGIHAEPIWITLTEQSPESLVNIIVKDNQASMAIKETPNAVIESAGEIYPNPVTGQANLEITLMHSSEIIISVINNVGQPVYKDSEMGIEGYNLININVSNLPNGIYNVLIQTEDGARAIRKFVKL